MLCTKCGANISDKSVFCEKCGFKIANEEPTYNVNNEQNKATNSDINNIQENVKLNQNNLPNDKNKIKKIAIICIIAGVVVVVVVAGGIGIYQYNRFKTYNNLITTANKEMEQGEYGQAIALFNQSLQYKNDSDIQKSIKLVTDLKEIKWELCILE